MKFIGCCRFAVGKMVNVRFRGVELEESAKSEEARRRNPSAEAERELFNSVGEAYLSEAANIGQSRVSTTCTLLQCLSCQVY